MSHLKLGIIENADFFLYMFHPTWHVCDSQPPTRECSCLWGRLGWPPMQSQGALFQGLGTVPAWDGLRWTHYQDRRRHYAGRITGPATATCSGTTSTKLATATPLGGHEQFAMCDSQLEPQSPLGIPVDSSWFNWDSPATKPQWLCHSPDKPRCSIGI